MTEVPSPTRDEEKMVAALQAGDDDAFERIVAQYQRRLRAHCYRMVGSAAEADDMVQETFLRAWRGVDRFAGRSAYGTWLYRIATNVCLDALAKRSRSGATPLSAVRGDDEAPPLEAVAPIETEPDVRAVGRETAELALLAAVQLLPPRQRAVLILRDVFGWSAIETAAFLDITEVAANSSLQRARATMQSRQLDRWRASKAWTASTEPQRAAVRSLVDAHEHDDGAAMAALAHAAS